MVKEDLPIEYIPEPIRWIKLPCKIKYIKEGDIAEEIERDVLEEDILFEGGSRIRQSFFYFRVDSIDLIIPHPMYSEETILEYQGDRFNVALPPKAIFELLEGDYVIINPDA